MGKVIFHIDVNSAFLSWEAVYRLYHLGGSVDLREQVSAVGGDMAMRQGIILAKSIPAKRYKIQTGETILEAQRKCSNLMLVPPNYGLYERCSLRVNRATGRPSAPAHFESRQLADCPAYLRNLAFRYNCPAAGSCSVADRFRLEEPDTVRHLQEARRHR